MGSLIYESFEYNDVYEIVRDINTVVIRSVCRVIGGRVGSDIDGEFESGNYVEVRL